jgi:hypothetical protein
MTSGTPVTPRWKSVDQQLTRAFRRHDVLTDGVDQRHIREPSKQLDAGPLLVGSDW